MSEQQQTAAPAEPTTRVYFVQGENEFRLVEARSKQAAINHVVNGKYKADIANQKTLIGALRDGVQIEKVAA